MKNSEELSNRMVMTNRGLDKGHPAPCPTLVDQLKKAKHKSADKLAKAPKGDSKPAANAPKEGE